MFRFVILTVDILCKIFFLKFIFSSFTLIFKLSKSFLRIWIKIISIFLRKLWILKTPKKKINIFFLRAYNPTKAEKLVHSSVIYNIYYIFILIKNLEVENGLSKSKKIKGGRSHNHQFWAFLNLTLKF